MIFPQVSTEKWCRTYNLKPLSFPCENCGVMQTPSIPWAFGTWRGLMAPLHECGQEFQLSMGRDFDPKEAAEWNELLAGVDE